ncbi:universal stress protein [Bacillus sp. PK3_68]|uniref:universal stress protein n=1 Tax=Bacillus sp. PK3_68 TaxID=2027408 RepID=UPI000E732B49|nr:universal stress protein [Bacillus sp. PK3_68]RJS61350.1 universal stress protein UspA [Bacillus sp. PK3_68]
MTKYENILVAVDGSKGAQRAFAKALDMAVNQKARLTIVHVVDATVFLPVEQYKDIITAGSEEYGRELLDRCEKKAKEFGVENVRTALEFGSPKGQIPGVVATKYEADLIVVGATGLNALERFLLGSVSEAVIRYAPCDVLIARE